jgi:hypothetical protein
VEHVLACGEREGTQRRLVDVSFMAAYLGAWDGFVLSWFSVKWKTDGLKLCQEHREAELLYSLVVG